MKKEVRKFK